MSTYSEINVQNIIINKLSTQQYQNLLNLGQLKDDEIYITIPENFIPNVDANTSEKVLSNDGNKLIWTENSSSQSSSLPILSMIYSDHIINSRSWIRAQIATALNVYDNGFKKIDYPLVWNELLSEYNACFNRNFYGWNPRYYGGPYYTLSENPMDGDAIYILSDDKMKVDYCCGLRELDENGNVTGIYVESAEHTLYRDVSLDKNKSMFLYTMHYNGSSNPAYYYKSPKGYNIATSNENSNKNNIDYCAVYNYFYYLDFENEVFRLPSSFYGRIFSSTHELGELGTTLKSIDLNSITSSTNTFNVPMYIYYYTGQ